jgi:methionyl-tRNA formyltransferase
MKLKLDKNEIRFGLIGSGKLITMFAKLLLDKGFLPPLIVTYRKNLHKRDQVLLKNNRNYEDIFQFSEKYGLDIIESDNVNNEQTIKLIKKEKCNIIFSIKSRWIISEAFIKEFDEMVYNIHQGDLPYERGGTTSSQRILNNVNKAGVTIHKIEKGIDSGPILYKKTTQIDVKKMSQDDMNDVNMSISINLLCDFISDLEKKIEITEKKQSKDDSIYLPQLYTELNGAINWDWNIDQLDRFIRAFGPPFPGAFTFHKGKKINILKGYIEFSDYDFHPLYWGRIIGFTERGDIKVAANQGVLIIELFNYDGIKSALNDKVKVSHVFYTPAEVLLKAKIETKTSLKMKPPNQDIN